MDCDLSGIDLVGGLLVDLSVLTDDGVGGLGDGYLLCLARGVEDDDDVTPVVTSCIVLQAEGDDTGGGIPIDPMLGAKNLDELKKSYEENNSDEDDYSLTETTVNGCRALILKYSDWLGSTMRVDIDFGGKHGNYDGMSFAVSGDSLEDCDTDLVWAIIESMELAK